MRGREKFDRYYKFILLLLNFTKILPYKVRISLLVWFRNTSGHIGLVIRYVLLKSVASNIGKNVSIYPNVFLYNVNNLIIGDNVSIHPLCYIDAAGGIIIGNNVSIAHSCSIMSTSHNYDEINIPIKDQGISFSEVLIKDNVWLGAKVTVLSGVKIDSGAIVGANSVLTKNVIANDIVAGVPARFIKKRI